MNTFLTAFLIALVPSLLTGVFMLLLERSIRKRDREQAKAQAEKEHRAEEKEKNREELDKMLLASTSAALTLGEATAKAVQRIPDAHCNGDMHAALDYAAKVKDKQKDFLTNLGVHALHED